MALNVAIQMNDPASFNPKTDSTIMLGLEAQKRGHVLCYFEPHQLSLSRDKGVVASHAAPITFFDNTQRWYEAGAAETIALSDIDVALMRNDPPYDMHYLSAAYLLEKAECYVSNNPVSVITHPEKISPFLFREFMPDTLITQSTEEIMHFANQHSELILKPLYGFGGRSVFKTGKDDSNFDAIMEHLLSGMSEPIIAQQFLPDVTEKDARILIVDGAVKASIGRIPAEGEIRANFRVGGTAAEMTLTEKQQKICDAVSAWLKDNDIIFAGLDLIGDYLTEVNITCPTGLRAAESLYGINVAADIWDAIESRL